MLILTRIILKSVNRFIINFSIVKYTFEGKEGKYVPWNTDHKTTKPCVTANFIIYFGFYLWFTIRACCIVRFEMFWSYYSRYHSCVCLSDPLQHTRSCRHLSGVRSHAILSSRLLSDLGPPRRRNYRHYKWNIKTLVLRLNFIRWFTDKVRLQLFSLYNFRIHTMIA